MLKFARARHVPRVAKRDPRERAVERREAHLRRSLPEREATVGKAARRADVGSAGAVVPLLLLVRGRRQEWDGAARAHASVGIAAVRVGPAGKETAEVDELHVALERRLVDERVAILVGQEKPHGRAEGQRHAARHGNVAPGSPAAREYPSTSPGRPPGVAAEGTKADLKLVPEENALVRMHDVVAKVERRREAHGVHDDPVLDEGVDACRPVVERNAELKVVGEVQEEPTESAIQPETRLHLPVAEDDRVRPRLRAGGAGTG